MAEGEFDQFADLGHLFTAAANIVVADFVEICLLLFTLHRVTLCSEFRTEGRGKRVETCLCG